MRIACLQFNPQVSDVDNNMTRADRVLAKGNPENLDLLVLPEMAFSGYNYKSLSEIHSSLEPTAAGISSLWARTTALKHNCHVAVGYPEKADVSHKWPADPEYYNSAVVVGPDGDDVAHYRKAHLYYTDETWALEGDSGFYGDHITGLGQTAIGICMDINPYKFEAPWDKFEFAHHILHCDANLVVLSMAWLTLDDQPEFTSLPHEPDFSTLSYWTMRLEPLIRAESDDEIIVVFANRCGTEGETLYAGTSAVLGIRGGEVNVYGLLGRCEKKLLVVDTNQPPIAKLVMTPLGIRLVKSSNGTDGTPPQTTPSRSSTRPDESEKRKREGSHERTRDRGSTPSRSKETKSMKESGASPAVYDSSRQSLQRLTPANLVQHDSPSLILDTPRKGKVQPPKLAIPDTGSRSWRKSNEEVASAPVGPGRTPIRKKSKDPFEAQVVRPASRVPDSAVVLSAVERERPRNGILSPGDSAIGRATPETRPRKSSRRSCEHRSSAQKDQLTLDTILPEEITLEEQAALRARTLKDSPVARRPDSSVLSHWLETLPRVADLEPVPGTSPAEPKVPSLDLENGLAGCAVCHTCGQDIPKGDTSGVGSKIEKKHISRAGTEGLGSRLVESGGVPEAEDDGVAPQNGVHIDSETRRTVNNSRCGEVRGALPLVEEGEEYVLQPHTLSNGSAAERETEERVKRSRVVKPPTERETDSMRSGNAPCDTNLDIQTETEKAIIQRQATSPETRLTDDDKPTDTFTPPQAGGSGTGEKTNMEDKEIRDPLAPRTRIVPPSIKGLEKVVTVSIRPSSVAW